MQSQTGYKYALQCDFEINAFQILETKIGNMFAESSAKTALDARLLSWIPFNNTQMLPFLKNSMPR